MGIGTSSSSSGASAPRANAYAVNRDASELRRSRAQGTGLSPAWPDACHLLVTRPPPRDGPPVTSSHVPFYLALEAAADAWAMTLGEHCGDLLSPMAMAVVNVTSNFRRELFVGEIPG